MIDPYKPESPELPKPRGIELTSAERHRIVIHMSVSDRQQSGVLARTLNDIGRFAEHLPATRKQDLEPGDCVIVSTKNSVYRLQALGGDRFHASGGWFDQNSAPRTVTVNGCTFGGLAIGTDIVAAIGLFLEFGNNVSTTRIQDVRVLRMSENQDENPVLN